MGQDLLNARDVEGASLKFSQVYLGFRDLFVPSVRAAGTRTKVVQIEHISVLCVGSRDGRCVLH